MVRLFAERLISFFLQIHAVSNLFRIDYHEDFGHAHIRNCTDIVRRILVCSRIQPHGIRIA